MQYQGKDREGRGVGESGTKDRITMLSNNQQCLLLIVIITVVIAIFVVVVVVLQDPDKTTMGPNSQQSGVNAECCH